MTNKEAKEVFLNKGFVNGIFDGDKWRESIIIISKRLKQESYKDLITEIDKLPRIKVGNSNSPTVKYCIDEVLLYDLFENMPSAEKTDTDHYRVIDISYSPYTIDSTSNSYSVTISKPTEQPAARWEWVQYESLPDFGNYHCSNCRHIEHKIDGYKYCPNCGSKMKIEKEEEE